MHRIRIGGVPEHFNMPWHYAIENNLFAKQEINLEWIDYPGGTGAMASALKNNEIDLAVMLTEGAISAIEKGAENTILGFYVQSPLVWGIHVATNSKIENPTEIFSKRFAISRLGSGSHLMAMVNAAQHSQIINESQFIIVQNIEGAIKALIEDQADIFLWEKFMTTQYVEAGIFRRIGEIPTPWPCFVIVARNDFLLHHQLLVNNLISIIGNVNSNFKGLPHLPQMISDKYKLNVALVNEWLLSVEWNDRIVNDTLELSNVKSMLTKFGII